MSGRVRVSGAGEAAAELFGEGWHVPGDSLGERGDGERRQHGAAHGGGAPRLDGSHGLADFALWQSSSNAVVDWL